MNRIDQPLQFEDRTGLLSSTDFEDIYDRMFLRVLQQIISVDRTAVMIFDRGRRSYNHHSRRHSSSASANMESGPPSAVLEFGTGTRHSLGTIKMNGMPPIPMKDYLKKVGMWGSSLNRRFIASDSNEYRWSKGIVEGQDWTCVNAYNQIVAHYDLRRPNESAYRTSGNYFYVEEPLISLSVEFLSTLIIMRHIEKYGL